MYRPCDRLTHLLPIGLRLSQYSERSILRCLSPPFLHLLSDLFAAELKKHLLLPQLLFLAREETEPLVRALAIRHLAAVSPLMLLLLLLLLLLLMMMVLLLLL